MPLPQSPSNPSDPASLLELALRIGGPPAGADARVSKEEERVAWALCSAALRRGDEAALERILGEFGFGLPSPAESDSLLRQSAQMGQAPGYEILARAAWDRWADLRRNSKAVPGLEEARWLRVFLRSGLVQSAREAQALAGRESPRQTMEGVAHVEKWAPIATALQEDSPIALAKALGVEGWMRELELSEPEPVEGLGSLPEQQHRELAEAGRFAEGCLLSQALRREAPRCALLLLSLPQFSLPLLLDQLPAADELDFEREASMRQVLKSLPKGFLKAPGAKPDPEADLEGVWRSHSFFERLLRLWVLRHAKAEDLWGRVVEAAIEAAPAERLEPQQGSGRGWAEMIARHCPSEDRALARARGWIERLSERGASVDWARVGRLLGHKNSPAAHSLAEWAELRGERLPAAAPSAPRRM